MRILLVGGTGLIGSAIHARLKVEGHDCVLLSRHKPEVQNARHIALNIAQARDASAWKPVLVGIDAVMSPGARRFTRLVNAQASDA